MQLRHAARSGEHDKARVCVDFEHRPKSWEKARRFVARIEASYRETTSGHLTGYCVTSLKGDPDRLLRDNLDENGASIWMRARCTTRR